MIAGSVIQSIGAAHSRWPIWSAQRRTNATSSAGVMVHSPRKPELDQLYWRAERRQGRLNRVGAENAIHGL